MFYNTRDEFLHEYTKLKQGIWAKLQILDKQSKPSQSVCLDHDDFEHLEYIIEKLTRNLQNIYHLRENVREQKEIECEALKQYHGCINKLIEIYINFFA